MSSLFLLEGRSLREFLVSRLVKPDLFSDDWECVAQRLRLPLYVGGCGVSTWWVQPEIVTSGAGCFLAVQIWLVNGQAVGLVESGQLRGGEDAAFVYGQVGDFSVEGAGEVVA